LEEFRALGGHLRQVGRFHEHRRALLSGPFDIATIDAAPRVLISAAAVPYRPNRGAYIVVEALASPAPADGGTNVDALLEVNGVAGVWTFVSDEEHRMVWRPGRHRVTVCFLDESPLGISAPLGEIVARWRPTVDAVVHAGPLEAIIPWRWDWFDVAEPGGG